MSPPINAVTAERQFAKHVADVVAWAFVFDDVMVDGETIDTIATSIETVSGTSTDALVLSDVGVNAAAITGDRAESYPAERAVVATVSGGTAEVVYGVTITVTTSGGETLAGEFRVHVQA